MWKDTGKGAVALRGGRVVAALCGTCLAAAVASAAATESILYVDDDAPPGGDGLSWPTAYRHLQDAIYEAYYYGGVDEIRIGQGIYMPDLDEGGHVTPLDRTASFKLVNAVAFRGGYAGVGAEDPDERDIELYQTILSGDLAGDDEPGFVNYAENSYRVMDSNDPHLQTTLDGLTITGGNANEEGEFQSGAGVGLSGDLIAVDCRFEWNTAFFVGGALAASVSNESVLTECVFRHNRADWGGAIHGLGNGLYVNCSFEENEAYYGGAVYHYDINYQAAATLVSCIFTRNHTDSQGAAIYLRRTSPSFEGCVFEENDADSSGGAVFLDELAHPRFVRCLFRENSASGAGAIRTYCHCDPEFLACSFLGNRAREYSGGAIRASYDAPVMRSCLFSGNSAVNGGAVAALEQDAPVLVNCTITNNSASEHGGGVFSGEHGGVLITSCILWGNEDLNGTGESSQVCFEGYEPVINYSCVENWTGGFGGEGNFGDDPLLVDPLGPDGVPGTLDDDLHLTEESPCIHTGDPDCEPAPDETDMDGEDRVQFDHVDIGADESPFLGPDCNGNGINDTDDINSGFSQDCNENGIPDECDIDDGTSLDCNENGVPDECDLADGTSLDCNENGIPDECDIDSGVSEDCNLNGVPDECDIRAPFEAASGELGIFGWEHEQSFTVPDVSESYGDVNLLFTAHADLWHDDQWVDVDINGVPVGRVYQYGAEICADPPEERELIVPEATFNEAVADEEDAVITMIASEQVDAHLCLLGSFITVQINYIAVHGPDDANHNGIPDECECPADFDADGDVDTADLLHLLGAWGTAGGDVDFDGDTDTADLLALLAAWGECP